MPQVEHEQVLIGRRWAKEGVEVYENFRGEFGGASGMVDLHPGLIAHDERVGCEGFGTVGTPFREARNSRRDPVFVIHDEHDFFLFLTSLSPTRSAGVLQESIPVMPGALASSKAAFFRNGRVQQYVPPS